jgi:hypothetical protein
MGILPDTPLPSEKALLTRVLTTDQQISRRSNMAVVHSDSGDEPVRDFGLVLKHRY